MVVVRAFRLVDNLPAKFRTSYSRWPSSHRDEDLICGWVTCWVLYLQERVELSAKGQRGWNARVYGPEMGWNSPI
ncbi:hypothetical protein PsW74_04997 [Pseudovibrio sp. W74]|nr:hypothetical protein PsW74_04997 [Pseudovibrio sp. W74]